MNQCATRSDRIIADPAVGTAKLLETIDRESRTGAGFAHIYIEETNDSWVSRSPMADRA